MTNDADGPSRQSGATLIGFITLALTVTWWAIWFLVGVWFIHLIFKGGFGLHVEAVPTRYLPCLRNLPGVDDPSLTAEFAFQSRSFSFVLIEAVELLVAFGVCQLLVQLLRRLLASVKKGASFSLANVKRLRLMGALIVAWEPFDLIINNIKVYAIERSFVLDGLALERRYHVDLSEVLLGLLIIVIAEVVRQGSVLDEEQSLTI